MNDIVKSFCNSVNYKTYNNIKNGLYISFLGVHLSNFLFVHDNLYLSIPLSIIASMSYVLSSYLSNSDGIIYTKDVSEIRALYQEFITNYNELNRIFDFKEPISIYTMFTYLFEHGYLSKDKVFRFDDNNCVDISILKGANIINGNGVCRHIAPMLSDILNDYGIPSIGVACYMRDPKVEIKEVEQKDYSRDRLNEYIYKHIRSEKSRKIIMEYINVLEMSGMYVDITLKYVDEPSKKKKQKYISGNHAITFSMYNDMGYYLDPTQSRIYRLVDSHDGILYDKIDDKIILDRECFKLFNNPENNSLYELHKNMFIYDKSISLDEEEKIISTTQSICIDNMDIFDKFYNENKDLYNEISHKLVRVRKR